MTHEPSSDPTNIYAKIDKTVDEWTANVVLKHPATFNAPKDVNLNVQCTTTSAPTSYQSFQTEANQSKKKYSVFLLGLNFVFAPHSSAVRAYCITVRALADSSLKTSGPGSTASATELSLADSKSDDLPSEWRDPTTTTVLPHSTWPSTSPANVSNATSYTNSNSYTLGGQIGFFGSTPTGDVSGGVSISHSDTVTVSPVRIINKSDSDGMDIRFILQTSEGQQASFQPRVQGILRVEDDGLGIREIESSKAGRELVLELTVRVFPVNHRINREELVGPFFTPHDRWYTTYHTFRRIFTVRMPPIR